MLRFLQPIYRNYITSCRQGVLFILKTIFQSISGKITLAVKSQELSKQRKLRKWQDIIELPWWWAHNHSISFLCGNNIAVSYSSGISSFIRHQVMLLQLCWESQQWIWVSTIFCIQFQDHSCNKQNTSYFPIKAKPGFKAVYANLHWNGNLIKLIMYGSVYFLLIVFISRGQVGWRGV